VGDRRRTGGCSRWSTGTSPTDVAAEDYEVDWAGRPTADDLNATGREQLGLP